MHSLQHGIRASRTKVTTFKFYDSSKHSRRNLSAESSAPRSLPLDGVKVLELGQLIAGPFAGTILAYFGADVIKVEPPKGGDPIRRWRELDSDGTAPWWHSIARNKRSVAVDLSGAEGRDLIRRLAARCDVVVENFRPGKMEEWGLGPDVLAAANPSLVMARVSGYGQTGPYASRLGYASVCEAVGGFRHLNGHPGSAPVRPNLSLGDSLAGLHAALGVVLALLARHRGSPRTPSGQAAPGEAPGQVVDVAIYESVFNMLEAVVPEYDRLGKVRQPSGTTVTGIVPTNTYLCSDGKYVVIGGNGDSIFRRLMTAAGRSDLANDPELSSNAGRVRRQEEIDAAIGAWTATRRSAVALATLEAADVPAGAIYAADDMLRDPHFAARGMFEEVVANGRPLKVPAIAPKLLGTPGSTRSPAPTVGQHTDEVLRSELGFGDSDLAGLRERGVVG